MPVAMISTSTSPARGPSRSTSWISSGWFGATAIAARVFMISSLAGAEASSFSARGAARNPQWQGLAKSAPTATVYSMQRVADRPNLSDELASTVRDMILDGGLPAGERVNEVHLAARLGVSRTPVREALSRLVSEGAVTIVPRLGFFICPLTAEEVEDIYPMRALLDPAALRLAGIPPRAKLERLKTLNR